MEITELQERLPWIKQSELASKAGVNQSLLSLYVRGVIKPNNETIDKLNTAIRKISKEISEIQITKNTTHG